MSRTDEEKAAMYAAMTDSVSVITNCLDNSNDFCNDMTNAEKKERVMRSAGYMEAGVALTDWGSQDFTAINQAIITAKAYTP